MEPGTSIEIPQEEIEIPAEALKVIIQLRHELAAAREKEVELLRLKTALLTRASHEFRTPLTVIDGVASRMSRQAPSLTPTEIEHRCETIRNSVSELLTLIDGVLKQISSDLKVRQ
tara:strand:- start:2186 stop:2533 length:348 start_codon:yes stop_codon:yes gene_type:complete